MDRAIREKLIELARLRTTWSYSQLNEQLQLGLNFNLAEDRQRIGEWLGDISVFEHQRGRPLLSCLITHKGLKREQGDGFYKLCEELFGEQWQELKQNKKWENGLIADCYEFWLDPINFRQYKNDN